MKIFKKLTALILALGVMTCFAACGGNGGEGSESGNNGGATVGELPTVTE